MLARGLIVCILLLLMPAIVGAGPIDDALAATRRGDYDTAVRLLRPLADQGNARAQYNIGVMYRDGMGVPQDYAEALRWLRRAADQGHAAAQYNLGVAYVRGEGVPQDHSEAVRWYRKAADQGNVRAQNNLGVSYNSGRGVPQDHSEAVRWYRKAADQGNAVAQYNLGIAYNWGEGVPQDHSEAVRWYRKAADQGHAAAQYNLGIEYVRGEGVPQDHSEAVRWFRKAADQGDADAQYNLGIAYVRGEGVPQDHSEAVRWFRKAADQGNVRAQNNLGTMYEDGRGAPSDLLHAHKWYNLAASRSSATDKELQKKAVGNRDRVASRMTSAQIAEAQRLARQWQPNSASEQPPPATSRAAPPLETQTAVSGELVRKAQGLLARLGFHSGPEDGKLGAVTRRAVQAYQRGRSLTPDGDVTEALVMLMWQDAAKLASASVEQKAEPPAKVSSTGTGFLITGDGHILTNAHVVEGCREIRVRPPQTDPLRATMVAIASAQDLAILKSARRAKEPAGFRTGEPPRLGDSVVVFGFPLSGALSSSGNLTTGIVSALAGLRNDPTNYQISAPVQPGNSGGPLLDGSGNVVGVVASKLDTIKAARATGDISQNVNFAIKANIVLSFLEAHGIRPRTAASTVDLTTADIARKAQDFTIAIECLK